MNPEDIKTAVDAAIAGKVLLTYPQLLLFVLLSGVAAYLGAYVKKKGENLATKEDLDLLTKKMKDIRIVYSKQIEDYKAELLRRSQASRIAEILARNHYGDGTKTREFVQLAWELSIWLPPDLVRQLSVHLVKSGDPKQLLISVRKFLHGNNDELTSDQIIHVVK